MDKAAMMTTLAEAVNTMGVQIPPNFIVKMLGIPGLEAAMLEAENEMNAQLEQQMPPEGAPAAAPSAAPPMEMPPMEAPIPEGAISEEEVLPQGMGMNPEDMAQLSPEDLAMIQELGMPNFP
jgi:uncharacterized protein with von Willebrand factor type A (vWA) domain